MGSYEFICDTEDIGLILLIYCLYTAYILVIYWSSASILYILFYDTDFGSSVELFAVIGVVIGKGLCFAITGCINPVLGNAFFDEVISACFGPFL